MMVYDDYFQTSGAVTKYVDNLILILFCYLFGVDSMRVITMVIDKLIVFNCSIYA